MSDRRNTFRPRIVLAAPPKENVPPIHMFVRAPFRLVLMSYLRSGEIAKVLHLDLGDADGRSGLAATLPHQHLPAAVVVVVAGGVREEGVLAHPLGELGEVERAALDHPAQPPPRAARGRGQQRRLGGHRGRGRRAVPAQTLHEGAVPGRAAAAAAAAAAGPARHDGGDDGVGAHHGLGLPRRRRLHVDGARQHGAGRARGAARVQQRVQHGGGR